MFQSVWNIWVAVEKFPTHIGSFILYPHWTQSQVPGLHADTTVSVGKVSFTSGNIGIGKNQTNPFICVWWISFEPETEHNQQSDKIILFLFETGILELYIKYPTI